MLHKLASLRKLQYLTSSFSTCIFLKRGLLFCQVVVFVFGLLSTIVGRFYFHERHNLYGCRSNYKEGFPVICPFSKRPSFIDLDTAFCYGLSFISVIIMIIIPMIWSTLHWRCNLGSEITYFCDKALVKDNITDNKVRSRLQRILLSLEHANTYCRKADCKKTHSTTEETHKFMVHLGSCLWSELFLLYQFKRWKCFVLVVCGITLTMTLPFMMTLSLHGWNATLTTFGMILFFISPFFSGLLLLILISCMVSAHHPHVIALSILFSWCFFTCAMFIFSFVREGHDEQALMRYCFKTDLPFYVTDMKVEDVDVLLYLRGYGEYHVFFGIFVIFF